MIDVIYDAVNNEVNTQEEIDDIITDQFSVFADYTADMFSIPSEFKSRKVFFNDPTNLIRWIAKAGIPTSATIIWKYTDGSGNIQYKPFISPTS